MSVIFMLSLSLANIESATLDVQKSRLKMVERRPQYGVLGGFHEPL